MSGRGFGGHRGGGNGANVWWPAGLERLTPRERADALKRGWWADGDHIVTRQGDRLYRPAEARRLQAELTRR